jgi:inorganic pyrophosphatase
MAVAVGEKFNPIAHVTPQRKLKDFGSSMYWNMGFFPQTRHASYLSRTATVDEVQVHDGPLGAIEIGTEPLPLGSVAKVKILGSLGVLIHDTAAGVQPLLNWKLVCIRVDDPLAKTYLCIKDVPESVTCGIREWFRWYNTPDGWPPAAFAFDEMFRSRQLSHQLMHKAHGDWKDLTNTNTIAAADFCHCLPLSL